MKNKSSKLAALSAFVVTTLLPIAIVAMTSGGGSTIHPW